MTARILIVDDTERWRETFKDIVATMEYDVDVFEKLNEVKNSLITTKYDLALLDIDLKSSEGYLDFELICQLLHDQYPQIPIVAISGQPIDPEYMFNLPKREGIKGFVSKKDKNLIATLRNLIKDLAPLHTDTELDELQYSIEDQQWYTSEFPPTKKIDKEQIDTLKEDIDVVIITATDIEVKAVMRFLKPYPKYRSILLSYVGPETYYLGKFGECRAIITKCQMGYVGKGATILATDQAQRLWRPRAVIMVGIAFGKDVKHHKIGDVLVASEIIPYDVQRVGKEEIIYRGKILSSNTALLNRFENAHDWLFSRPDGKICNLFVGPILSGEKLVDDPNFKSILFRQFPQAIGGEMEGAGLSAACERAGVAWMLAKSICDWGDGKKHNKHQALAAAAAASLAHHVLCHKTALDSLKKQQSI